MLKSLSFCVVLFFALLVVPAALAEEAPVAPASGDLLCAAPSSTSEASAATEAAAGLETSPDGRVYLSNPACDSCSSVCAANRSACLAGCGSNYACIRQCSCDFYWCMDACPCGEQDPPPVGC
ncbi:MAG: hypothetical protein KDD11_23355 [Acidobacteria bacterium]|nr:hypothetical protein [Acidobacteriota bacterium]